MRLKKYIPREYWSDRLKKEGARYVGSRWGVGKQVIVFRQSLLQLMQGTEPGHILDFGCGVGRFAETALTLADSYTGVDINEGAFEYTPDLPLANFVGLPGEEIPFEDGHFDSAMSFTVLQHIVAPEEFKNWTSEISRVVKPEGYFYIIDDATKKKKMGLHMRVRGPQVISEALGAEIDEDFGAISAEHQSSHFMFRARKQ